MKNFTIMSNVKSGTLYNTVVCGYCEQQVHLGKQRKAEKSVVALYQDGWGKSEHFGFVCPDCVRAITKQGHGHVWIAPNACIVSTKQVKWINTGERP